MRYQRKMLIASFTALAITLLAACGSSSDSDAADGDSGTKTGAKSAALVAFETKTKADLEARKADDPARPPTSGPKAVAGEKHIYVIACAMAALGCSRVADGVKEAAKVLGWKVTLVDTQSDPTKAAAGFAQAISARADGIFSIAIDSPAIQSQLQAAKAAGIPTVATDSADPDGLYTESFPSADALKSAGYAAGAEAYELSNGKLRLVQFRDPTYLTTQTNADGAVQFVDDCKAAGGDCKIEATSNILAATLVTKGADQAVSVLRTHPDANVIWTAYDAMALYVIKGLKQAGINDVPVIGLNGDDPNLAIIRADGIEKATAASVLEWKGWWAIDDFNRLFAGEKPLPFEPTHRILTKDAAAMPDSGSYIGYGGYPDAYRAIWGR